MGFQNRYINSELVKKTLLSKRALKSLFNNETLIFEDKVSSQIYELHSSGISDEEIQKLIYKQSKNMEG